MKCPLEKINPALEAAPDAGRGGWLSLLFRLRYRGPDPMPRAPPLAPGVGQGGPGRL